MATHTVILGAPAARPVPEGTSLSALYHHFLSTCSQKVRLVLAEKRVEFESHPVDLMAGQQHDPDYVKLNPNHGQAPAVRVWLSQNP